VTAWERGAAGERKLGALLETLASERIRVLHDRRIPGTVANIDHIVVSPSGTYIIDAKNYGGRVEQRDKGGFLRSDFRLYVAGRDRTRLVEAMDRQAEAVKAAAGNDVTVIPVLCFVASRGLLQRPFSVNGVVVTWPRDLVRRIARLERPASDVPEIASQLEAALPPA
jgi:hypothetical protein